jgi:glycosyltransferase involved in cell wall biosynthesis
VVSPLDAELRSVGVQTQPATVSGRRPVRICFVAPAAYPVLARDRTIPVVGGAEVQQSFIAAELARRGHDVSMISMDYGQHEGEKVEGVRLLKMHSPDAGLPVVRFLHPRLTSVWAAMQRADADVYYQRTSGALTGFVAAFARQRCRRSVFAGAHDLDFDPSLPLIAYARDRWLYRYGLRHVDQVVVQTQRQLEACRTYFGRDSVQVPSCYGHAGQPARHDGVVLWVGTVKPIKRPEIFVELAGRLPQYRFRMVGGAAQGGGDLDRVRALAKGLGNIEFTGFVPYADVEQHFDGAAVHVSTSSGEGFPNTFLQAWSRGIPTVSFFDAGASLSGELVGRVVSGLEPMVRALVELKENNEYWTRESSRVRHHFEAHHGLSSVGDAYEAIIDQLCPQRV